MSSHGWVTPRPDGARARCGGPAICSVCQKERAELEFVKRDVEQRTCKTCRHWRGGNYNPTIGKCYALGVGARNELLARQHESDEYVMFIATQESFGCIHHEEKE